jgi:Zn-dependent protease
MLLIHLLNLLIHNPVQFIITIIIIIIPLFISIAFHEWAHGYVAYQFGDPTPKLQGRLTLNPFAHLDPLGTLMLFIVGIGWAKPIILNPLNYPDKTKQMLVALAGPAMNFLLAILFGIILTFVQIQNPVESSENIQALTAAINIIIKINLILAIFNMIPIPPLDGSRIIAWMLPERFQYYYLSIEPLGIIFLLLILFFGGFGFIINFVDFIQFKVLEILKIFLSGS